MSDMQNIQLDISRRGITRLCHFTRSRKLASMLAETEAILPTSQLSTNNSDVFDPTDTQRLDGYLDYVCCSVEYPNTWYLDIARKRDPHFKDWIILCLDPRLAWERDALFCPRNAASSNASFKPGWGGWNTMFSERVLGARGITRSRGNILSCSPTDDQAEVLIPGLIPSHFIHTIIVRDERQAHVEQVRFRTLGLRLSVEWRYAPALFDRREASDLIHQGRRPQEYVVSGD